MFSSRRSSLRSHLIALLGGVALAGGCAGLDPPPEGAEGGLDIRGSDEASVLVVGDDARPDARQAPEGGNLNPLCGLGFCDPGGTPDDPNACAGHDAGGAGKPDASPRADAAFDAPAEGGHDGNDGADASAATDGGPDGGAVPVDAGATDASADGKGDGTSSGFGGSAYDGPAHVPGLPEPSLVDAGPTLACHVTRATTAPFAPLHTCAPSGNGATGAPCASPSDCRAGFACVGTEGTGHCLPYCCHDSTCESAPGNSSRGTYCGEKPLLGSGGDREPLFVPVCVPVEPCDLLRPHPCEGPGCVCTGGTACMVVRGDGTTGCRKPGTGRSGAACNDVDQPCAAGYFCSKGSSLCLKICKTSAEDVSCAPGHCHASPAVPEGFGLCAEEAAPRVK